MEKRGEKAKKREGTRLHQCDSARNQIGPTPTRFITKTLGKRKHERCVVR